MPPVRTAIYVRLSRNRKGEQSESTRRQEAECRKLVEARGWSVEMVLLDDDVSAYSGKRRPGYEELTTAIDAGLLDAVVAWAADRLHRSPRELEDFVDLIERTGIEVATVQGGRVDLGTPGGRMNARMLGSVARYESEHRSERTRLAHDNIAKEGRWSGGPRPYGYRPTGDGHLAVDDDEAAIVREAAARVLAGETLYGICADLNRRGVPTVKASTWRTPTLRRILTGPTIVGRRLHQGETVAAVWDPILDEVTFRRLGPLISDPTKSRARPARAYLLTGGVARCGLCGKALIGQRRNGRRIYVCGAGPNRDGCGGISVSAEPLERIVAENLWELFAGPELVAAVESPTSDDTATRDASDELEWIEGRVAELADMYAAGEIGRIEWIKARTGLEERQAQATATLARNGGRTATLRYIGQGDLLAEEWEGLTLDQQRAVVGPVIDRVIVAPSSTRGRTFDDKRVSIERRI